MYIWNLSYYFLKLESENYKKKNIFKNKDMWIFMIKNLSEINFIVKMLEFWNFEKFYTWFFP